MWFIFRHRWLLHSGIIFLIWVEGSIESIKIQQNLGFVKQPDKKENGQLLYQEKIQDLRIRNNREPDAYILDSSSIKKLRRFEKNFYFRRNEINNEESHHHISR